MSRNIDDDAGECWLKVLLENGRALSAPDFSTTREEFYRNGDELNIHGKISKVFSYFAEIPENDIKGVNCQVSLRDPWIHRKIEIILSGLAITCKDKNLYGPNNINFDEIDEFLYSVENILSNFTAENSVQKTFENSSSRANSIFKIEEIHLDEDEIYSTFLDNIFGCGRSSRTCTMCGLYKLSDVKTFSEKMENLTNFTGKAASDTVDIDENVWLYLEGRKSDKIKEALSNNGCSCEIITGPNNSKQLKISSVRDNSNIDEAVEAIVVLYQTYAQKIIIVKDIIVEDSKEYELVKKYVNDEKIYGRCSYKICGPKNDLSEFETKFEMLSTDHKKNETKEKSKPVSENVVRVEHVFQSGLKIFISKGNLVRQRTDAIVNPANSQLQHGGGAAAAIAKAAGKELESECKEFIKKEKSLPVTKVMHTTAGNLKPNIKYVIHTVGPENKKSRKKDDLFSMMLETFVNCFKYANEKLSISSIAVPAISSGIFGVLIEIVGSAMFEAVEVFDKERKSKTLKEIHFVNIDETTVGNICKAFKEWNKGSDIDGKSIGRRMIKDIKEIVDELDMEKNGETSMEVDIFSSVGSKPADAEEKKVYSSNYRTHDNEEGESAMSGDSSIKSDHKPKKEGYNENMPGSNDLKDSSTNPKDKDEDQCAICLDEVKNSVKLKCAHAFCGSCLEEYNKKCNPKCPTCGMIYGEMKGNQPDGSMHICNERFIRLPGYKSYGALRIDYRFRSGIQNETHPNPGQFYHGTFRTAYLPDNEEGREVAKMFKRAFDNRLLFTIGSSHTTGRNDAIVWNDIHQKTSIDGPCGYPDPGYLKRVKEELAAKGIYPEDHGKQ